MAMNIFLCPHTVSDSKSCIAMHVAPMGVARRVRRLSRRDALVNTHCTYVAWRKSLAGEKGGATCDRAIPPERGPQLRSPSHQVPLAIGFTCRSRSRIGILPLICLSSDR
jgi:hypothetical protein